MSGDLEIPGVGRTGGARNETVQRLMNEAAASGLCPFCSPQFEKKNGELVLELEGIQPEYWHVWSSPSPFDGTSYHIMMAPKRDVSTVCDLTTEELVEQRQIVWCLLAELGFVSFTLLSRQGKIAFNSATVTHLHYHIIVSSGDPARIEDIDPEYLQQCQILFELFDGDLDKLNKMREALDVFREAKLGKAVPIRAKLSNKVGINAPN